MKILVDLTCCEKGHSYGVYAFRVLSVWREYNSSNVDIILLIKEEMEAWAKKEFPEWKYILLKQYFHNLPFLHIRLNILLILCRIERLIPHMINKNNTLKVTTDIIVYTIDC